MRAMARTNAALASEASGQAATTSGAPDTRPEPGSSARDGRTALVEVKAVDAAYPLYGSVALDPPQPLTARWRSAMAPSAPPPIRRCWRGSIPPGARITLGAATIEIRAALTAEPDKPPAASASARACWSARRPAGERASSRQRGALVPRLRLPDNDATDTAVRAVTAAANAQLPEAGWEIRSRANASPSLEKNVERFTQYLTLVGLTALVGGVGVANAVKGHLDRRRDVIATLKSLGATGSGVHHLPHPGDRAGGAGRASASRSAPRRRS